MPYVEITDTNGTQRSTVGAAIAANSWKHLAVVAAGGKITLFLDGAQYAELNAGLPAMNTPLLIGGDSTAGDVGFIGEMDELEISKVARSAGFIKLAALGQGGESASKLLAFEQDEQPTNWLSWLKGGYFGIIISSLTFDGWAVIIILTMMMVISWLVMVHKASYLNAISKGNALFLKEWRHMAGDLTVLDHADADGPRPWAGASIPTGTA